MLMYIRRNVHWSAFCLFITFPQQNNGLPFCQIVTVNRNRNLCFPETKFNIFFAEVDWHRVTSIVLLFLENLETIDAERYCQEIDEIWPEIRLIMGQHLTAEVVRILMHFQGFATAFTNHRPKSWMSKRSKFWFAHRTY